MRKRKTPGLGSTIHSKGRHLRTEKRIVVSFDDETFDAVRARALAESTSFAEQVRQLVEWGLEAERAA